MVHSQLDNALLFPASQSGETNASVSLRQIFTRSGRETEVHSSGSERVLVIMAKAPRAGAVKTRLVPDISPEAVTGFYSCLLADTLALARSLKGVEVAIMCPESDLKDLVQLAGNGATVVAQKGEGLAAGLTSVFAHFTQGHRRTIAFNADSPHLPPSILESAFETLAAHDMVVGPTHDGGYYLIGAQESYPTLFEADGLGTRSALERLLARSGCEDEQHHRCGDPEFGSATHLAKSKLLRLDVQSCDSYHSARKTPSYGQSGSQAANLSGPPIIHSVWPSEAK